MYFVSSEIEEEYNRLANLFPDLPEYKHPLINFSDALRAYMTLADYYTDPSSNYTETMLVGLRSADLLYSALSRQVVGYDGHRKYTNDIEICSTLFYGMVKNHSFSDGNKRTALLTLLFQLNLFGQYPSCSVRDYERLVVAVAANTLSTTYQKIWKKFEKFDDPEVKTIAYLLRRMTKKKDHSYHIQITAREMASSLERYGVANFIENGKIHFRRTIPSRWFRPEQNYGYSMVFGGWTRSVGAQTARDLLKALKLYDEFADYQSIIEGQEPYYSLIQEFDIPLRRLKDE